MTPQSFEALNKQGETTLHNVVGLEAVFKWIELLIGGCGTIMPLVAMRSRVLAAYRQTIAKLVPHYSLVPYFLPLFAWKVYRNLLARHPIHHRFALNRYNEVVELILSMGFFLFAVFQWRKLRSNGNESPNQS